MTILQGDIKLVASQVMDDVPEGGGAPTSTIINDGVSNSIFNDISELDRAGGRVNLRKVFGSVQSDNVDGYFGVNVIVSDAPNDPNVNVTLFSTGDTFDERDAAKARIESYLAQGPTYAGYLFGNHIEGQQTLTLLARTNVTPPVVGDTLVLSKLEGTAGEFIQFVRVTDASVSSRDFEDSNGVFTRSQISLSISDSLRADFPGFDALRYDTSINFSGKTRVSETVVADAARYYGVVPLTVAADTGDFTVQASGIFSQLVPSAQIETPIADARMNQQSAALVESGGLLTMSFTLVFSTTQQLYVGGGISPSSLSVVRSGITLVDNGGVLLLQSDGTQVGLVDYANGVLSLSTSVFGTSGGSHVVSFKPAAQPSIVSESFGFAVTQASQRLTYVATLDAVPVRGSLNVSYRAGGRWYVLQDDGSGALRGGDSSAGVGTINFTTGTLSLTLGALPDVGSEVIGAYSPQAAAPSLIALPVPVETLSSSRFYMQIEVGQAIKPGTLAIAWNDGTARTAGDLNGSLTGSAAVGDVIYGSGVIRISPNALPTAGTVFSVTLTNSDTAVIDASVFFDAGTTWTFTLPGTIRAGSVELGVVAYRPVRQFPGVDISTSSLMRFFDDGAGNLKLTSLAGNLTVGTINYGTGACAIQKTVGGFQEVQSVWDDTTPFGAPVTDPTRVVLVGNETRTVTLTIISATGALLILPAWAWWTGAIGSGAKARYASSDGSSYSQGFALSTLFATRGWAHFGLGSDRYDTNGLNQIQRNINPSTGVGDAAGTMSHGLYLNDLSYDYGWGYATLTLWTAGVSSTVTNASGVAASSTSLTLVDGATFRTAVSPLRNGSFSVVGAWSDGTTFSATADSDGIIKSGTASTGPLMSNKGSRGVFGRLNYETGVCKIRFGSRVDAANAGAAGVVDMSDLDITGVQYVLVEGARADVLRYNASAYVYLPLDADILGIDPVRLPSDGRVPIFRPGSFVVIGNTITEDPQTVANGDVVDVGRVRLSRVRVIGANGVVINTGYTVDLEAGMVTFTSVSGYSQPVEVEHRIEDMMLVSDAQISGQLSFTRAVTHDYPVGSYVSSALVFGDMHARVSTLFDQQTWSNVWSDSLIGSSAAATYNDVLAPVVVTNKGASTERWALVFTGTTAFNIVGEHVGIIASGSTAVNQSPINPATGDPYFTILALGWGSGWAAGNVLRLNTVGALAPIWVVRTIKQGPETETDDSFTMLVRGDVDHP
jgi:hypothetical protein